MMWGKLAVALFFVFVAFLGIGGWWLEWRKAKDRRQQIDIDKQMEILQMVKIPPLELEKMKGRIRREIRLELRGGKHYLVAKDPEIEILQMPQDLPELHACDKFNVACAKQNCHHEQKGGG